MDLSVDDELLSFGKDFQKKFVVGEICGEFPRNEREFQFQSDELVKIRRRKIFLTFAPQSELRQTFGQNKNFRVKTQANPHQIIGQLPKAVHVEQMKIFVSRTPHHRRRMTQAIRVVKKIIQPLGTRAIRLLKNFPIKVRGVRLIKISVLIDEFDKRKARRVIRIGVKEGDLLFQFVRRPQIVRMMNSDIFTARRLNGVANGNDRTAIDFVEKIFYSGVVEGLNNFATVIGGAVVDNQQLKIGERLIKCAVNRRRNIRRMIVARQNDADFRSRIHCAFLIPDKSAMQPAQLKPTPNPASITRLRFSAPKFFTTCSMASGTLPETMLPVVEMSL